MADAGRSALLSRLALVLVRPEGPINVGLICRAAANLGVSDVRIVAPVCDITSMECRKFANHAQDLLASARVYDTLRAAISDCIFTVGTSARRRLRGTVPICAPETLNEYLPDDTQGKIALVFGSESEGLGNDELHQCQVALRLRTPGPYDSYNLSHAVAITLYTLAVTEEEDEEEDAHREGFLAAATKAELDGLYRDWLNTLDAFGYFRRTTKKRFAPKLMQLLGRLRISQVDARTLRGMIAHFARTLENNRDD